MGGAEGPPPHPACRKEGSLVEQGSAKNRKRRAAASSDPHTASHAEISGPHFSFAPPPPYGLNRVGQGLASGRGWQGALSFPRITSLPGSHRTAPGTARQRGLFTPSASHQAELGVGLGDSPHTPPNCPFPHPAKPRPLSAPSLHYTNSPPS